MSLVSIAMYVTSEPLADATAELWSSLRHYLLDAGLKGLPEKLDQAVPYDEAWLRPDLLLSQACGYPFARSLRGRARLVATPIYGHPGCDGPLMRSFIVVRKDSPVCSLADLRGTTAAINSPDSNSGSNFFRAAVAPLADSGRFFGRIIETGSHRGSIAAVAEGRAESASIDCVTYANIRRFDPGHLQAVRIIAETPKGPGLPFITSGDASATESFSCEMRLTPRSRSHRSPPCAPHSASLIFQCFPKPTTKRSYRLPAMHYRN